MARLAIRATGDRSKRENVTTGDTGIIIHVYNGNREEYIIIVERHQLVVYKDDGPLFHDWIDTSETHSA